MPSKAIQQALLDSEIFSKIVCKELRVSNKANLSYFYLSFFLMPWCYDLSGIGETSAPLTLRHLYSIISVGGSGGGWKTKKMKSLKRSCSLLVPWNPNLYERFAFRLLGLSISSITLENDSKIVNSLGFDEGLREAIKKSLENGGNYDLARLVGVVPRAMIEGLTTTLYNDFSCECEAHYLSPLICTDEQYIYFVSRLKAKGIPVIAQPHGAYYFQTKKPSISELSELAFCDFYKEPNFSAQPKSGMPWMRPSKFRYSVMKRLPTIVSRYPWRRSRSCIVFPSLSQRNILKTAGSRYAENYLSYLVASIKEIFSSSTGGCLVLRFHPRETAEVIEFVFNALSKALPSCDLVIDRSSANCAYLGFRGVYFWDVFHTGLIEKASVGGQVSVIMPKYHHIRGDYLAFLKSIAVVEKRKKFDIFNFDSKDFGKAYAPSYLYPFRLAKFVKNLVLKGT